MNKILAAKRIFTAILTLVAGLIFVFAAQAAEPVKKTENVAVDKKPVVAEQEKKMANVIAEKKLVSMEYTLYIDDNKRVDSNVGGKPFKFIQGSRQIIPGLEKQIAGLKEGDERTIVVMPEEGYGPYHEEAVQEIPRSQMPKAGIEVGAIISGTHPSGRVINGKIKEIKGDKVVVDFNHPLAGKKLTFKIKVLKIEDSESAPAADK